MTTYDDAPYDDIPYGDEWPDDPDADPYYTEQAERAAIRTFADDYPDYVSDCYETGTPPLPLYQWVAQRIDAEIAMSIRELRRARTTPFVSCAEERL